MALCKPRWYFVLFSSSMCFELDGGYDKPRSFCVGKGKARLQAYCEAVGSVRR